MSTGKTVMKTLAAAIAALGLAVAATAVVAHRDGPAAMGGAMAMGMGMGPGMMHGMGRGAHGPMGAAMSGPAEPDAQHDAAFAEDMQLVRELVHANERIARSVTNLPDGIRTVTESDDPRIAQAIKAHVASMAQRLGEGREFNLFSTTIPVLFENREKITTAVETTEKGVIVTQTAAEAKLVAALQAHAAEVDELVREGMVAMMRGMRRRMASMRHAPGAGR